jgi:hypothetical protein
MGVLGFQSRILTWMGMTLMYGVWMTYCLAKVNISYSELQNRAPPPPGLVRFDYS